METVPVLAASTPQCRHKAWGWEATEEEEEVEEEVEAHSRLSMKDSE